MKKKIMPLEIIFSIIVVLSIIFVVTLISFEIKIFSQRINKKSEAAIISSNILENIKIRNFEDVEKYIEELSFVGISKRIEGEIQYITVYGNEFNEKFFGTQIPNDYIIELQIENYGEQFNLVKNIKISVKYLIRKKVESVDVSTVIERESIGECNSPIINDEYFSSINIELDDYEIIPIKYLSNIDSYIVTSVDDVEWYNYSSKKWAKVAVFTKYGEDLKSLFVNQDGSLNETANYNGSIIDLKNYIYVWIPNFSIKDDISYFRYGTGKKAIKMELLYNNNKFLYLNKKGEDVKDISEECSFEGVSGVWRKLGEENDPYYSNFNLTKYAPIDIY